MQTVVKTEHATIISSYPVMESFYTLQGEGAHMGKAAYFIRLGGCDVGCVWCDVKESWDANLHIHKKVTALVEEVQKTAAKIVVITGGEPLMYDCESLTASFREAGYSVHLETSGAYPLSGKWDWICVSPKKFKFPLPGVLNQADELKVVAFNKSDLKWAEENSAFISPKCRLFIQPEWSKKDIITPLLIDFVKGHPEWELSLQTHKYINIP